MENAGAVACPFCGWEANDSDAESTMMLVRHTLGPFPFRLQGQRTKSPPFQDPQPKRNATEPS